MNKASWNASLFLLAAGMLVTGAGLVLSLLYKRRETMKGHAVARVVELILDANPLAKTDEYQNCFYPVFEFYAGGRLYKIRYEIGSLPSMFSVGQRVRIDFDPEDPSDFVIAEPGMRQYIPEIVAGAGLCLFLLGILIFFRFAVRS